MELGEPFRTLVFLVAVTGLRISETLGLKWGDLDYEGGSATPLCTARFSSTCASALARDLGTLRATAREPADKRTLRTGEIGGKATLTDRGISAPSARNACWRTSLFLGIPRPNRGCDPPHPPPC